MEGGAIYNFTGPQAFGNVDTGDAIYCIKKHVFEDKDLTMQQIYDAMEHNFGVSWCWMLRWTIRKIKYRFCRTAAAAMESVSVSSEDSMESSLMLLFRRFLQKKDLT